MLNAIEVTIARELAKRRHTTKEQLFDRLYSDRPRSQQPAPKIIDLLICKLRRKLPEGTIKTVWGEGYEVSAKATKVLRSHVAKSNHA